MTIQSKLWLMTFVSVAALVGVFGSGKMGIDSSLLNFDQVVDERVPKLIELQALNLRTARTQSDVRDYILVKDHEQRLEIEKRVQSYRVLNKAAYQFVETRIYSAEGRSYYDAVIQARVSVAKNNDEAMRLAKAGQEDEAIALITSNTATVQSTAFRQSLQNFVDYQVAQTKKAAAQAAQDASSSNYLMIGIALFAMLLLVAIAFFVIKEVANSIKDIVTRVTEVAQNMSFKTRLPVSQDELGAISVGLNQMLGGVEKSVSDIQRVTQALAAGDFSQRITENYTGDLAILKEAVNASISNIETVMHQLSQAVTALKTGVFAHKIQVNYSGAYGKMLDSLAQTMQGLDYVIAEINTVMQQVSKGVFDQRIQSQSQGDLQTMTISINKTIDDLDKLTAALVAMANAQEHGDMTMTLSGNFQGRLKVLQDARSASTAKMKEVIQISIGASDVVRTASDQVYQGASDLSSRVQEQASVLKEASATMNEMSQAVQENTTNARKVADLAKQVQHKSNDGVSVMQETITAMQSIRDSSYRISDIVTLIDGIAFQTNLLALNAAVEAARAGEHGRGFAVVASEVRALAGKSADAAKEIKNLIADSVNRIENGTQLADKSGVVLNEISDSVKEVATMIDAIANASNAQSNGIQQVHNAINDIDRVTQENAALVEETNTAAHSLGQEAQQLRQAMSFFHTGTSNNVSTKMTHHVPAPARKQLALPSAKKPKSDTWNDF